MKSETVYAKVITSPRIRIWTAVFASGALLLARKPWALTNPQLWAEDGSVHLNLVDQWGARAFFIPDRGYLNVVPRLIAWVAKTSADVAWWPGIYNTGALVATLGIFARLASSRIQLPGKPWLILAFVLVPCSGEVFLNITNLHWLLGFFFVLQAMISRPSSSAARLGDLVLVILAGLTDPSAIIFLPLMAWRWWRDRHADNLAILLATGTCAVIQAYFLHTTGPHFAAQSAAIDWLALLERTGSRLLIAPILGPLAVSLIAPAVQAVLSWGFLVTLIVWTLRPHERQSLRIKVIAAWVLISVACAYRIRPDTWDIELSDLGFAEPYFYMSRILLVWLLVWEFDAVPSAVGRAARTIAVMSILSAMPRYREPPPLNYHWADNCEPIRQGVPARIPTLPEGWTLEYHGRLNPRSGFP